MGGLDRWRRYVLACPCRCSCVATDKVAQPMGYYERSTQCFISYRMRHRGLGPKDSESKGGR